MIIKAQINYFRLKKNVGCLIILTLILVGCDYYSPKKSFKMAISETDYSYNYSAQHFKSFLENGGFSIEIIPAASAIEANKMVAEGVADLTFVMNQSNFMPQSIGTEVSNLRTIMPLFPRLFYLFSRHPIDTTNVDEIFKGKSIGVEVMNGETYSNLRDLLSSGRITDIKIVSRDENPDFIHFWGTSYGVRASDLLNNEWSEVSISEEWINYFTLNDPALSAHKLPAVPGVKNSRDLHTLSAETLLVGNSYLGEEAIYELNEYIFNHKLDLMRFDKMYKSIDESFFTGMLYPLHVGTDSYLKRNLPSFFERYAELIALIISALAILYGSIQGVRAKLISIKKERIDLYFLEYSDIRSQMDLSNEPKIDKLNSLLSRSLLQMTEEKLDKDDFDIFSRLVQQEISILQNYL